MWEYEPAIFGNISLLHLKVTLTLDIDSVTVAQVGFGHR